MVSSNILYTGCDDYSELPYLLCSPDNIKDLIGLASDFQDTGGKVKFIIECK